MLRTIVFFAFVVLVVSNMDERTGVFTSGIVSTSRAGRLPLYFTGRQHAGENLAEVLKQRVQQLGPRSKVSSRNRAVLGSQIRTPQLHVVLDPITM